MLDFHKLREYNFDKKYLDDLAVQVEIEGEINMGLLRSFFTAMLTAEMSEKKRIAQEQERERERALKENQNNVDKILKCWENFINYLTQINCRGATYDEVISSHQVLHGDTSSSDVLRVQQKFDEYKCKLKEFMQLGGNPSYLSDLNKLDTYILIIKRLKEYNWLDRQEEYLTYDDTYWIDKEYEWERKDRHIQEVLIPGLVNSNGNELNEPITDTDYRFVPFVEQPDAIVIQNAYSFTKTDSDLTSFLDISVIFTDKSILIYNRDHTTMYYKADVTWKDVEVLSAVSDKGLCGVEVYGIELVFIDKYEREVSNLYLLHNLNLMEQAQRERNLAAENIDSLTGVEFERVCKQLLEKMGFSVETTKVTGDGGIDLIAYNFQPLLSGKYIIQCKRYAGSVGEPIIRDLYGVITSERANKGILMTSGVFTKQAQIFADGKPIELIDGVKLQKLLQEYYY